MPIPHLRNTPCKIWEMQFTLSSLANNLWSLKTKEGIGTSPEKNTLQDLKNAVLESEKYSLHHHHNPLTKESMRHETASQAFTNEDLVGFSSSSEKCGKVASKMWAGHQSCIIQKWIRSGWSSKIFANFAGDQILLLTAQSDQISTTKIDLSNPQI